MSDIFLKKKENQDSFEDSKGKDVPSTPEQFHLLGTYFCLIKPPMLALDRNHRP